MSSKNEPPTQHYYVTYATSNTNQLNYQHPPISTHAVTATDVGEWLRDLGVVDAAVRSFTDFSDPGGVINFCMFIKHRGELLEWRLQKGLTRDEHRASFETWWHQLHPPTPAPSGRRGIDV